MSVVLSGKALNICAGSAAGAVLSKEFELPEGFGLPGVLATMQPMHALSGNQFHWVAGVTIFCPMAASKYCCREVTSQHLALLRVMPQGQYWSPRSPPTPRSTGCTLPQCAAVLKRSFVKLGAFMSATTVTALTCTLVPAAPPALTLHSLWSSLTPAGQRLAQGPQPQPPGSFLPDQLLGGPTALTGAYSSLAPRHCLIRRPKASKSCASRSWTTSGWAHSLRAEAAHLQHAPPSSTLSPLTRTQHAVHLKKAAVALAD